MKPLSKAGHLVLVFPFCAMAPKSLPLSAEAVSGETDTLGRVLSAGAECFSGVSSVMLNAEFHGFSSNYLDW